MSTTSPPGPDDLPYRGMMPALANPGETPILWASLDGVRQNTFQYHEYAETVHEGAESAVSQPTGQQGSDTLPCGHDSVWEESGDCMACQPAWQTPTERESREELDINRQPEDFA